MSELAKDLDCGWHAVMDAVLADGQVLVGDPDRFGDDAALGMDETLRCRLGRWRHQVWTTQIVEGRTAGGPIGWLSGHPQEWRNRVEWVALDLSGPYRKTFDLMLDGAT